jgi:membrane-bound lytic murein transglycosylase
VPWWQPQPLVQVPAHRLPPLADDLELESLRVAVERTVPVYERSGRAGQAQAARTLLATLDATRDPDARRQALAAAFRVMRVREPLLLTSYYEPEIAVSEIPNDTFRYPIYRRPPDLTPHYVSRAEIEGGALQGRGLELAWTNDPLELFFLHVQGSGKARFPDGHTAGLAFAGTNGLQFKSLSSRDSRRRRSSRSWRRTRATSSSP